MKIACIFFLCISSFITRAYAENVPIKVCTHLGFEPYVIHQGNTLSGIDVDIVKTLFQQENMEIELVAFPWARVLVALKEGDCQIGFSLFDRESRRHFVDFIFGEPLHISIHKVFVKKGTEFEFEKVSDLFGRKIGHNRGFSMSHALELGIEARSIHLVEYDDPKGAINMLHVGRIDAILDNEMRINYYLKNLDLADTVTALDIPFLAHQPAFLVLSKKANLKSADTLKSRLNKRLTILKRDGIIDEIINKYR